MIELGSLKKRRLKKKWEKIRKYIEKEKKRKFEGGSTIRKGLVAIVIILTLLIVCLSGCNDTSNNTSNTSDPLKPDEYGIIGTWVGLYNPDEYSYRFFSDKTFTFSASVGLGAGGGGTWEILDDKLYFTVISGGESVLDVYGYSFLNNGNDIILTNEKGSIYLTKQ